MATNAPLGWLQGKKPPPAVKPTGLTAEFLRNPLLFMRLHSVSPPDRVSSTDGAGVHAGGYQPPAPKPASQWVSAQPSQKPAPWVGATPTKPKQLGSQQRSDLEVERVINAGSNRHIKLIVNPKGAVTFQFALPNGPAPDGSFLPISWLPWQSLQIKSHQIAGIPHGLADWDDEEYPRFFFTAGLSGCSVFVQGDPQSPTVSHAGTETALKNMDAGDFWRSQMVKTKSGYFLEQIRGEVNANEYSDRSVSARRAGEAYKTFLQGDSKDFNLDVLSRTGCVFGIRYGRSWTFYLQKTTVFQKCRFYKEADLEKRVINDSRTDMYVKGTNTLATLDKGKSTQTGNKLGPIPLPGKKDTKIYSTTQIISMPLEVIEIFPNRKALGELKDVFNVR